MAAMRRYDEELRAVGQALEARNISVFDLKQPADSYLIEGTPDPTGSIRSKVRQWLPQLQRGSRTASLVLGLADLERLSRNGRAKRSDSGRIPNFQSVSSILRTIGAYLDARQVKLIELQKRRISITLVYRDNAGRQQDEDRSVSSFYHLFLELCGKRSRANQTQVPSKS